MQVMYRNQKYERSHSATLRNQIERYELMNWKSQPFVPYTQLRSLLQPSIVRSILRESGLEKYQEEEAFEAVTTGGHRVFGILNAIGQERSVLLFRKNVDAFLSTTLDSRLPYDQQTLETILPDLYLEFYRTQWKFTSPVFKRNLHDRVLSKRTILPYIRVEEIASRGSFAEVCRVTIPGSHQQIISNTLTDLVLVEKRLNLSNDVEQAFNHEQHILSMLGILKHPNIVEFHSAFTFDSRPTLLLSTAEYDLKEWLRGNEIPPWTEVETLQAVSRLSSALHRMHQYLPDEGEPGMVGCHFDLHPGNILIRDRTFILSDFGLSRLKYEAQGSQSYFKGGVRDYCAPECQQWDENFDKNRTGRPSDVWSFGCIVAEIATFLKHGLQGLLDFDNVRRVQGAVPTLRTFHDRGRPHPQVDSWINALRDKSDGSRIVQGLAGLVFGILAIDPRVRPDAHGVSVQLYQLLLHARYGETKQSLLQTVSGKDYGWKLEVERFAIWANELGLDQLRSVRDDIRLSNPSLPGDQEHTLEVLLQIREGCESQVHHASDDFRDHSDGLQLHVLRKSINELWQMQTPKATERMNMYLENVILTTEDRRIPEVAAVLEKGSRPQLLLAIKQALTATNENMGVKDSFQVDRSNIGPAKEWQQRILGKIRTSTDAKTSVLVEFLQYDDSWIGRSHELIQRINGLVSVMSKVQIERNMPILRCINYCHYPDRQAYGLVFEIPKRFAIDGGLPVPINLEELMKKTNARIKRPALGEIFNLAHTLATSMTSFHTAGWLHKSISAYNMVFFPRNSDAPGSSLSTFRLVGFNHSRESDKGVATVGPRDDVHIRDYQHPEYRRMGGKIRFREEFDYYSLGLVLLELGRWKSLRDMTKAKEKRTLSPQDLRKVLLREEVSQLKSAMGIDYQIAVEMCLNGFQELETGSSGVGAWAKGEQEVARRLTKGLALHTGTE